MRGQTPTWTTACWTLQRTKKGWRETPRQSVVQPWVPLHLFDFVSLRFSVERCDVGGRIKALVLNTGTEVEKNERASEQMHK